MSYHLGVYIPNCADLDIKKEFPTLCTYPPEIIASICERQPTLCQPIEKPSIWEPIFGTAQEVGERILKTGEAAGKGVLGTLDVATVGLQLLPLVLIGGGILWFMTQRK